MGQLVDIVVETCGPKPCLLSVIESLPRDRPAHADAHRLAPLGEHFAWEQCHFEIEFYSQPFAEVGDGVETAAVMGLDVDRYDITMVLQRFFHHCWFPFQVDDLAFDATRAKTSWEIEHNIVGSERIVEGVGRMAVAMHFVDGDKHRAKPREVHQEIVDRETDIGAMPTDSPYKGHAVGASQGMVGDDDGVAAGREAVGMFEGDVNLQIVEDGVGEIGAFLVAVQVDATIQFFDMQEPIQKTDGEFRSLDTFGREDFFQVDIIFCNDRFRVHTHKHILA